MQAFLDIYRVTNLWKNFLTQTKKDFLTQSRKKLLTPSEKKLLDIHTLDRESLKDALRTMNLLSERYSFER
ncbi:MAG: hypothetical protein WCQ62_10835, partial [Sphaerochaeta sp.]